MDTKFTIKNFANIKIYLNVKTCFITKYTKIFWFAYTKKGFLNNNEVLEHKIKKKNIVYNLFQINYNVNEFSSQEIIVDFPMHPSGEFIFNLNYNDS